MQIMRGYERGWVVFRFTVIPRSFRWFRIFILPSVREERLRRDERRMETKIQRKEAVDLLRKLQSEGALWKFQKDAGIAVDGRVGPRTIEVARRVGKARHAHEKHADRLRE